MPQNDAAKLLRMATSSLPLTLQIDLDLNE